MAPPAGMVSWWTADGTGDDFIGTHHGSVQATYAQSFVYSGTGEAFLFDGLDAIVQVPSSPDHEPATTGAFSVDAWAMPVSSQPGNGNIVGKGNPFNEPFVVDYFHGVWRGFIRDQNNQRQGFATAPAPIGSWSHLVLTWDGASVRFYVNGNLIGTDPAPSVRGSSVFLGIGLRSEAGFDDADLDLEFDGLIDEVEYFNRALSGSEVADLYAAGPANKCKCVSIFNSPTGDPVLDDPDFQQALLDRLLKGNAYDPDITQRLEEAGYVYSRPDGSHYTVPTVNPSTQTACEVTPGGAPPPVDTGDTLVGVYHSHPFSHGDAVPWQNCGFNKPATYSSTRYGGGSKKDWDFIKNTGHSSYIIDKDNVYRLDDGVPERQWPNNQNIWAWDSNACGI